MALMTIVALILLLITLGVISKTNNVPSENLMDSMSQEHISVIELTVSLNVKDVFGTSIVEYKF